MVISVKKNKELDKKIIRPVSGVSSNNAANKVIVAGSAPKPGDIRADVLLERPAFNGVHQISHIDSQKCYEMNYSMTNNKVGNYIQKTNNYMHEYPDSCSGTRQELITAFYQM